MIQLKAYLFVILATVLFSIPCQAEVHLNTDTLTVNVHETTMQQVLEQLSHQSDIDVIVLEETQFDNVKISKTFWNLPIQEGLDRLLSEWNYGINRDASTGKIATLYLVSRRTNPSTVSMAVSKVESLNGNSSESSYNPTNLSETYNTDSPELDDEFEEFAQEPDFPSEEELENLPPDLREHLEKLYRHENE